MLRFDDLKDRTLSFDDLKGRGVTSSPAVEAIYERVRAGCADRYISFEFWDRDGGMRIYRDRIRIWLPSRIENIEATIAHELSHAIIQNEQIVPRLHPDYPGQPERYILSDLIGIPEHILIHRLMAEYQMIPADDSQTRSARFLSDIASAPLLEDGQNIHLAIGYAMMLTVHRSKPLLPMISSAIRTKTPSMASIGEGLADYVSRDRETTLYQDAVELMEIAGIRADLRLFVMSPAQFRARFGWV